MGAVVICAVFVSLRYFAAKMVSMLHMVPIEMSPLLWSWL
jgi:hypothetical protein